METLHLIFIVNECYLFLRVFVDIWNQLKKLFRFALILSCQVERIRRQCQLVKFLCFLWTIKTTYQWINKRLFSGKWTSNDDDNILVLNAKQYVVNAQDNFDYIVKSIWQCVDVNLVEYIKNQLFLINASKFITIIIFSNCILGHILL